MTFSDDAIVTDAFEENTLWKLTSTDTSLDTYAERGFDYPLLRFTVNWERKPQYYWYNIMVPIILVTVISLGVFWLPPSCGEKISLGITVLLAFSVFLIIIMDNTPINSESLPRISQ